MEEVKLVQGRWQRPVAAYTADEAMKLAQIFWAGGVYPRGCGRVEAVAAIIIFGSELGVPAGQALSQIYLCNGKPTTWGRLPFGMVRRSGFLESYSEQIEHAGTEMAIATFTAKRVGQENTITRRFSYADARKAQLFNKGGKPGPWDCHTDHMLLLRATARALDALFQDVLCGIGIAENLDGVDLPYDDPYGEVKISATVVPTTAQQTKAIEYPAPTTTTHTVPTTSGIITAEQRAQVKTLLPQWFASRGLNFETDPQACSAAWKEWIGEKYQIKNVAELTEPRATELLKEVQAEIAAVHPSVSGLFGPQETLGSQKEDTTAIKN